MGTNDKHNVAAPCDRSARSGSSSSTPDNSTRRDAVLRCVAARLPSLTLDELRVVDTVLSRMIGIGRDHYGQLDLAREQRDWKAEQAAEWADALFYGACHEVAANDRRLERLRCDAADEMARTHPVEFGLAELAELAENAPWPADGEPDARFDLGGEAGEP